MISPYGLCETLKLPVRYLRPPLAGAEDLVTAPAELELLPGDAHTRVVFAGDLMPLRGWAVPAVHPEILQVFRKADLVVANCEGPVDPPRPRWRPAAFRERPTAAWLEELLSRLEVDHARCAVSVANNHAEDRGTSGLQRTLDAFGELGITPIGLRADRPVTPLKVGSLRVGITAWSQWTNVGSLDGRILRTKNITDTDWRSLRADGGLDTLVAFPHWDRELRHRPHQDTVDLARALIDAGCDLIVGHHPHVLQPVEVRRGSLCLYSCGTLCGPAIPRPRPMRLSCLLEVSFATHGPSRGRPARYRVIPVYQLGPHRRTILTPVPRLPRGSRSWAARRLQLLYPSPP